MFAQNVPNQSATPMLARLPFRDVRFPSGDYPVNLRMTEREKGSKGLKAPVDTQKPGHLRAGLAGVDEFLGVVDLLRRRLRLAAKCDAAFSGGLLLRRDTGLAVFHGLEPLPGEGSGDLFCAGAMASAG